MEQHSHGSLRKLDLQAAADALARRALEHDVSGHRTMARVPFPTVRRDPLELPTKRTSMLGRWSSVGEDIISLSSSPLLRDGATASIAIHGVGSGYATVAMTAPRFTNNVFRLRVFLPVASTIEWLQPFAIQDAAGDWGWWGQWFSSETLQRDGWNELTVQIPGDGAGFCMAGLEFYLARPTYTALYIASES